MKGLTLIEPWGWCIAHAGKLYEHRSWLPWKSVIGRQIAIHAGQKYDKMDQRMIERGIPGLVVPDNPARGIVAVATVRGWVNRDNPNVMGSPAPVLQVGGVDHGCDLRWYGGDLAWVLGDVIALPEAVPCKGAQGLWDLPEDVEDKVRELIRSVEKR